MLYNIGDRVSIGYIDVGDDICGTVTGERSGMVLVSLDDYQDRVFEFDENKLKPATNDGS